MRRFTELYIVLDQTTSTNAKIEAMADYFAVAPPTDAAWAIFFLTGRRLKRLLKRAELRSWVLKETGYPEWLLDETYSSVGDSAETIALLLPEPDTVALDTAALAVWVEQRLMPLPSLDEAERAKAVRAWWRGMDTDSRFVFNKLITGALRVGVSQRLVVRALASHLNLDSAMIAHRLMGSWTPDGELMSRLADPDTSNVDASQPYPFFLAAPLTDRPEELGEVSDWQAEWKWDGIRAQLIRRQGQTFVWSRGEELLDGRFPEIEQAAASLPEGCVLDGEILAWQNDGPMPFSDLQKRIGRLKPGAKSLRDAPCVFLAYDLLEADGSDQRSQPLAWRRNQLERLLTTHGSDHLFSVPTVTAIDWPALAAERSESRSRGVEGLMLKRRSSPYQVGRVRGDWWKWKIDPYTVDAVLVYAQPGSGRRSNLLTDYTFAVWHDGELATFCKAYSGLDNGEIRELDKWIRRNTTERFGPVRAVVPTHVFEIAFEGIALSKRHKAGVAVRFPRISRWRTDLSIQNADSLETVRALLPDPK